MGSGSKKYQFDSSRMESLNPGWMQSQGKRKMPHTNRESSPPTGRNRQNMLTQHWRNSQGPISQTRQRSLRSPEPLAMGDLNTRYVLTDRSSIHRCTKLTRKLQLNSTISQKDLTNINRQLWHSCSFSVGHETTFKALHFRPQCGPFIYLRQSLILDSL